MKDDLRILEFTAREFLALHCTVIEKNTPKGNAVALTAHTWSDRTAFLVLREGDYLAVSDLRRPERWNDPDHDPIIRILMTMPAVQVFLMNVIGLRSLDQLDEDPTSE